MDDNNTKSSLADILLVIAKHIKLILLFTIIGVLVTFIYIKKEFEPEYTSTSVIFTKL